MLAGYTILYSNHFYHYFSITSQSLLAVQSLEFSWIRGTSINIHLQYEKERSYMAKIFGFFSWKLLLTHKWVQSGDFFSKNRALLSNFRRGAEEATSWSLVTRLFCIRCKEVEASQTRDSRNLLNFFLSWKCHSFVKNYMNGRAFCSINPWNSITKCKT